VGPKNISLQFFAFVASDSERAVAFLNFPEILPPSRSDKNGFLIKSGMTE
jgi:hypothetical protein